MEDINHYFICDTLDKLSFPIKVVFTVMTTWTEEASLITSIMKYIENKTLPMDPTKSSLVKRKTCLYSIIKGKLYMRGVSTPNEMFRS